MGDPKKGRIKYSNWTSERGSQHLGRKNADSPGCKYLFNHLFPFNRVNAQEYRDDAVENGGPSMMLTNYYLKIY